MTRWLLSSLLLLGALQAPPALAADSADKGMDDELNQWLPDAKPDEAAMKLQAEAKARSKMMGVHQPLGLTTLGLLAGTVMTGTLMREGDEARLMPFHRLFLYGTTASYLGAGTLALLAPKPFKDSTESERTSTTTVHRWLFYLHALGMASALATGFLEEWGEDHNLPLLVPHAAIGYTTFGLLTASATVMALDF